MKQFLLTVLVINLTSLSPFLIAQDNNLPYIDSIFSNKGEVYFKFILQNPENIHVLTRVVSIDNVNGCEVFAYANKKEFSEFLPFKLPFTILPHPGALLTELQLNLATQYDKPNGRTLWNFYPTYQQYISYMTGFAATYPDICKLDTVGTSIQGRLILAVKISGNVKEEDPEPQFLYTSSMHGDETTGYVLMMHLIDYLLSNFGTDPTITNLINSTEIYINPLANPDGTYHGGNSSVNGAIRYNANYIDINRNFPDPQDGLHPDGEPWQVETQAWMAYAEKNHFSMSANFHGGAEVFNYPWDTWSNLTADDDWWQFVGREWADTVHQYGPSGYFSDLNNGITNGYQWYEVNGGRQDYMNYWHHCREVTVEISNIKMVPANQLIDFWSYNYRSFLNYIKQSHFGFCGLITDTVNHSPVVAKVFIQSHDMDSSEVYSRMPSGYYTRPIFEGNYDVTFSSHGYFPKIVRNVNVSKWNTTNLNVQLRPLTYDAQDKISTTTMVYPNPSDGHFRIILPEIPISSASAVQILNTVGSVVYASELNLTREKSTIDLYISNLLNGVYFLKFNSGDRIYLDKLIILR